MPFYEYECAACGHYHEAMQKMTDAPLKACPACGKPRLVRLVSAPQFRLKGAGWYETDFKGAADAKRNLADSAEPAAKADDAKEGKSRVKSPKLPAAAGKSAAAGKARQRSARKAPKPAAKQAVKKTPKQAPKQAVVKAAKKAAKKTVIKATRKAVKKTSAGRAAARRK